MSIDVRTAVNSLVRNNSSAIENGKITAWESVETQPTEAEIDAEVIRLQAEYDAQAYARNRALAFPAWQEQLDMQYWDQVNGTTTWKDAVAKIKADNPK